MKYCCIFHAPYSAVVSFSSKHFSPFLHRFNLSFRLGFYFCCCCNFLTTADFIIPCQFTILPPPPPPPHLPFRCLPLSTPTPLTISSVNVVVNDLISQKQKPKVRSRFAFQIFFPPALFANGCASAIIRLIDHCLSVILRISRTFSLLNNLAN